VREPGLPEAVHGHCEVLTTRPTTPEEDDLYDAARRTVEQSVPTLNEFLGRVLTLDAALIGGGFVVAKGDVLPYWWGVAVLTSLFASLLAALYGLSPTRGMVAPYALGGLELYRAFQQRVSEKKRRAARCAAVALAVAFGVGLLGMIAKGTH
jgi:hypothetical protein